MTLFPYTTLFRSVVRIITLNNMLHCWFSRPSILLGFNLAAVLPRWSALIYIYRLINNQSKALIVYGMDYTGL